MGRSNKDAASFAKTNSWAIPHFSYRTVRSLYQAAIAHPRGALRIAIVFAISAACAIGFALQGTPFAAAQETPATALYLDPSGPIEARVDDLLKRMTLKEKVGQLNLPCAYVDELGKTPEEKICRGTQVRSGNLYRRDRPWIGFLHIDQHHPAKGPCLAGELPERSAKDRHHRDQASYPLA